MPPAQFAGGQIVDTPQIAQHLGRWRRFLAGSPGAAVERTLPALGLHHCKAVLVTPPVLGEGVGAALRRLVREQQTIRHVLPAGCAQILLPQARRPAQSRENGPDQIVLGLALVGRLVDRESLEDDAQRSFETVEPADVERLPVIRLGNGFAQEIVCEEAALECGVEAHAPIDPRIGLAVPA